MMAWANILYAVMILASVVVWVVAARIFVEWWDERAYKPRMRRGK
jgi:hypothetical protein